MAAQADLATIRGKARADLYAADLTEVDEILEESTTSVTELDARIQKAVGTLTGTSFNLQKIAGRVDLPPVFEKTFLEGPAAQKAREIVTKAIGRVNSEFLESTQTSINKYEKLVKIDESLNDTAPEGSGEKTLAVRLLATNNERLERAQDTLQELQEFQVKLELTRRALRKPTSLTTLLVYGAITVAAAVGVAALAVVSGRLSSLSSYVVPSWLSGASGVNSTAAAMNATTTP